VFGFNKPKITNFRADYAKHADFCDLFRADTKRLYVLAFLLTANHTESEQCFFTTVERAFEQQAVFKGWVRVWVGRRLIESAIEIVSPASAQKGQKRDLWRAGQPETQRENEIDTVTKLDVFERFVFVMSILERLSNWDCALLLECSMNKVSEARIRALWRLTELAGLIPRGDELPSLRLRAPSKLVGARRSAKPRSEQFNDDVKGFGSV
jgi:hypothetical protein